MSITSSWEIVISGWESWTAQDFGSGGQRTKFRFGETFSKNELIKDFYKNFQNLLKYLLKNLKILQNFSKLKLNKICENLKNVRKVKQINKNLLKFKPI